VLVVFVWVWQNKTLVKPWLKVASCKRERDVWEGNGVVSVEARQRSNRNSQAKRNDDVFLFFNPSTTFEVSNPSRRHPLHSCFPIATSSQGFRTFSFFSHLGSLQFSIFITCMTYGVISSFTSYIHYITPKC